MGRLGAAMIEEGEEVKSWPGLEESDGVGMARLKEGEELGLGWAENAATLHCVFDARGNNYHDILQIPCIFS